MKVFDRRNRMRDENAGGALTAMFFSSFFTRVALSSKGEKKERRMKEARLHRHVGIC